MIFLRNRFSFWPDIFQMRDVGAKLHFGVFFFLEFFKKNFEDTSGSAESPQGELEGNCIVLFTIVCPNCRRNIRKTWSSRLKVTETLLIMSVLVNQLILKTLKTNDPIFDLHQPQNQRIIQRIMILLLNRLSY